MQVTIEAIQALGGNGYINEYDTGRLFRDAKLYAIGAGTNEIRRMLIGRELFEAGLIAFRRRNVAEAGFRGVYFAPPSLESVVENRKSTSTGGAGRLS